MGKFFSTHIDLAYLPAFYRKMTLSTTVVHILETAQISAEFKEFSWLSLVFHFLTLRVHLLLIVYHIV